MQQAGKLVCSCIFIEVRRTAALILGVAVNSLSLSAYFFTLVAQSAGV